MKVNVAKVAYVEKFIAEEISEAVKTGNAKSIEKAKAHQQNFSEWKKFASTANIDLPELTMKQDINGKIAINTDEVLEAMRKHCKSDELCKYTATEIASLCVVFYGSTNASLNGFEQALRGFSAGWGFKWRPALNESGRTTAKATIALQASKIAELEKIIAELKNGKKNK
jgi:hypothetical protein